MNPKLSPREEEEMRELSREGLNNFLSLKKGGFFWVGGLNIGFTISCFTAHTQRFCKSYNTDVIIHQSSRENYVAVTEEKVYSLRLYSHLNFLL